MPCPPNRCQQAANQTAKRWSTRRILLKSDSLLGDGDIDFGAIFSSLSVYDYSSWAVLEWECAIKDRLDGAREGAEFIKNHMIKVSATSFEDFIDQGAGREAVKRALGLNR
jgi:hypothetical protein